MMLKGHCDEKFSELRKILDQQLNSNFELGASVAVEWKGKEVVNLYGGYKDENKNSEWQEDTIVNVFSVTKAVSGICISRLIDAGLLDVNKNVGHYWPEYACNGKENTKVIDFLTHRAGMFGFENDIPQASWGDWDIYVKALEKQKPFVTPGSSQGYHAVTFAWLVGELFKRIEGRTIGNYFKEEIANPLDIDFHIGLNSEQVKRCASITSFDRLDSIKPPIDFIKYIPNFLLNEDLVNLKKSLQSKHFLKAFMPEPFQENDVNSNDFRMAELPAGNGHGTASGLAKLFGILATGCNRNNINLMDESTLDQATSVHSDGPDTVLFGVKLKFGYCFMLDGNKKTNVHFAPIFYKGAFGHAGIGGSVAFGDKKNELGYSFVCNKQQKSSSLYKTSNLLTEALYKAIN